MSVVDDILASATAALNAVANSITSMVDDIENFLTNIIDTVVGSISDIVGGIIDVIVETFEKVADVLYELFSGIGTSVVDLINTAEDYITGLVDSIVSYLTTLFTDITDYLSSIVDTITMEVTALFNDTVNLFVEIADTIVLELQSLIDNVIDFATDLFDTVAEGINSIIETGSEVVYSIANAIETFITEVVDNIGGSLRDLLATIADLPDEIRDLASELIKSAEQNIAKPITELPINIIKTIVEAVSGQALKDADKMQLETLGIVFGRSPVERSPERMRDIVSNFMPENAILKTIVVAILSPLMLAQTLGGMAQANSQILLQEHALVNPYRLMEPSDIIRSFHFKSIDKTFAIEELRKTGYTESTANILLGIGENVPPAGELISWKLRGLIDDKYFKTSLAKEGWSQKDIEKLDKAAFFIPPPSDLITMAVRDVFSPDIAERFGQFTDFPPDFLKYAKQQGVSEEWAKNYWAAHWALPSVQMGFEMLHRGVIDQSDLELLMRASDIMPFWRDKLIEISYSPLTRVDVRRMHAEGVLSEKEVNKSYHDIGYDDENAQRLTDFTLALNKEEGGENFEELSSLTRSNIIGFFRDGLINRALAIQLLIESGIDPASASLFVEATELDEERKDRKTAIAIVINQAKSGAISFEDAQLKLDGLGLEELEKQKAVSLLQREESSRNKLPSKADLDKMITNNIIDEAIYLDSLSLIGYSVQWSKRFLQLINGKLSNVEE